MNRILFVLLQALKNYKLVFLPTESTKYECGKRGLELQELTFWVAVFMFFNVVCLITFYVVMFVLLSFGKTGQL